jgi:hypothetical protein
MLVRPKQEVPNKREGMPSILPTADKRASDPAREKERDSNGILAAAFTCTVLQGVMAIAHVHRVSPHARIRITV